MTRHHTDAEHGSVVLTRVARPASGADGGTVTHESIRVTRHGP
jgi:hypothetical protein